jgi:hypothetical protein
MTLAEAQTRLAAAQAAYTKALGAAGYSVSAASSFSVTRQSLESLEGAVVRAQRDVDRLTDAAAGLDSSGYGFATFD